MSNIAEIVWEHGSLRPNQVAIRSADATWTYGSVLERAKAVAGALRDSGVEPGDRVVFICPSLPEFVPAYFGVLAVGGIVVPMNTLATEFEICHVLDDSKARLVLAWSEDAGAAELATATRNVELWTLRDGLASFAPSDVPLAQRSSDDTAVILYTSGTTGNPKGAELTHSNLRACFQTFAELWSVTDTDVYGTGLPLFHVFGGAAVLGPAMLTGASISLLRRFTAADALTMIKRDNVSIFAGVPTMYNSIVQFVEDDGDDIDVKSLRLCLTGGASLPLEVLRTFRDRFGVSILEGWGMTETTGAGTASRPGEPHRAGTVGRPVGGLEAKVVDADGTEVPDGEVGDLLVRGPVVMKGYWCRPEATAEALKDGWLHTGDLAVRDSEGEFSIVGRRKELIIRGGYNVYPREIEELLYEHPGIREAAVLGVPDSHLGEEVAAVVATSYEISTDDLDEFVRSRLSAYKVPRLYLFVDELPKGSTGKILKRQLTPDEVRRNSIRVGDDRTMD